MLPASNQLKLKPNETQAHARCAGHWLGERIRFSEQWFLQSEDRVGNARRGDAKR